MSIIPTKKSVFADRPSRIASDLTNMSDRFNDLWNDFFMMRKAPSIWGYPQQYYPQIEVEDSDKAYFVDAELPGVKEDEVKLDLSGNTLTIRGEKKEAHEEKRHGILRTERYYGSFSREIPFVDEVETEQVRAELKNGILHVELPKKEDAMKRTKIRIKA